MCAAAAKCVTPFILMLPGLRHCLHSPAEFGKIALATGVGFAIMGFIGFFVKLIFIPINNIIVGLN